MAMIALSALRMQLDGYDRRNRTAGKRLSMPAVSRTALPRLLSLSDMRTETARLVLALNRLGTRRTDPILASMYRHLAHWPSYLSFSWLLLAPLDADGRLTASIQHARREASLRAEQLPGLLPGRAAPLTPALAAEITSAIEPFLENVIVKMLVVCAFLRRATA